MENQVITRAEYMKNASALFVPYYLQFATHTVRSMVDAMKSEVLASKDPHFNDIPLARWDRISSIAFEGLARVNKRVNGKCAASLSDGVCAAKAYASTLRV